MSNRRETMRRERRLMNSRGSELKMQRRRRRMRDVMREMLRGSNSISRRKKMRRLGERLRTRKLKHSIDSARMRSVWSLMMIMHIIWTKSMRMKVTT